MTVEIDKIDRRCPRLGGPVFFQYCLESGSGELPCQKVLDCWWELFDVVSFLKERLTSDQFDELNAMREKPVEKVSSLLDLIEQAKARTQSS